MCDPNSVSQLIKYLKHKQLKVVRNKKRLPHEYLMHNILFINNFNKMAIFGSFIRDKSCWLIFFYKYRFRVESESLICILDRFRE